MPTSNGQITGRMIRQRAIAEENLADASVATAKLADTAVTVAKTDEPVWVVAVEAEPFINPTLTTDWQELAWVDITIPSWVGQVTVFAIANVQVSNTSGSTVNVSVSCRIDDNDDGARTGSVANNETLSIDHVEAFSLAAPGSTVQASVYARVNSGTNSSNNGTVWAIVIGTR